MPTQDSLWAEDQYRLNLSAEVARRPPQLCNNSQQCLFQAREPLRLAYGVFSVAERALAGATAEFGCLFERQVIGGE